MVSTVKYCKLIERKQELIEFNSQKVTVTLVKSFSLELLMRKIHGELSSNVVRKLRLKVKTEA